MSGKRAVTDPCVELVSGSKALDGIALAPPAGVSPPIVGNSGWGQAILRQLIIAEAVSFDRLTAN